MKPRSFFSHWLLVSLSVIVIVMTLFTYKEAVARTEGQSLPASSAPVSSSFTYQGYLTTQTGVPVTGSRTLTFRLYSASVGSTSLWVETHTSVVIDNGLFAVRLGEVAPIPASLWDTSALFLGIQLEGDTELTPREPIGLVPVAQRALRADSASQADNATTATTATTASQADLALAVMDGSITSAKLNPTTGRIALNSSVTLTADQQILLSTTINVSHPARLLIWPTADLQVSEGIAVGKVLIDSQELGGQLIMGSLSGDGDIERATVSNSYVVSVAPGQHTIELVGYITSGSGTAGAGHTSFSYLVLSQ